MANSQNYSEIQFKEPFDPDSIRSTKDRFNELIKNSKNPILLDCKKTGFIDSYGIGTLIYFQTHCNTNGIVLILMNVPDHMLQVLKLTKIEGILTICIDKNDALETLKKKKLI